MNRKTWIRLQLAMLGLLVLSIAYVHLSMLNPIIYLDVVIWVAYGTSIFLCIQFLQLKNRFLKLFIGLAMSLLAIIFSYGIQSTIFFETLTYNTSPGPITFHWPNMMEFVHTFLSMDTYINRLRILFMYSDVGISKNGISILTVGSNFMSLFRLLECLGILSIPIIQLVRAKELFSDAPTPRESNCVHCKEKCVVTHYRKTDELHYDCPTCGKYVY